MKKKALLSGLPSLLTEYQWYKQFIFDRNQSKETTSKLDKIKNNLNKGQKIRSKNITKEAKQNKKILLVEATRLKKINPSIKRKELASNLEKFSENYKKVGLSKSYSFSHLYKEILK